MIVEPEMYDYTSNNWNHWNSNEKLKEKFGRYTGKIFDRFTTKDNYTWNITHNTGNTAVGDHRWFKRSTRKERPVTRDDNNSNNNNNSCLYFKHNNFILP